MNPKYSWQTPATLLITGVAFFALCLAGNTFAPFLAACGTTPLMLAVVVGALQNIFSKSAKYSLFDPCKEMAYIPLDAEQKTKGKAAVDVIGNPLGSAAAGFDTPPRLAPTPTSSAGTHPGRARHTPRRRC